MEDKMEGKKKIPLQGDFFLYLFPSDQIIEGFYIISLKISSKLHIRANSEINSILLFDCSDMCVWTFLSKLSIFVARSNSSHSWSIFFHERKIKNYIYYPYQRLWLCKIIFHYFSQHYFPIEADEDLKERHFINDLEKWYDQSPINR